MVYITTYCFEKMFRTFFPFFITNCNVFITSLNLEHLCSGLCFFTLEICMFVAVLDHFIVFFRYGFLSLAQFWLF